MSLSVKIKKPFNQCVSWRRRVKDQHQKAVYRYNTLAKKVKHVSVVSSTAAIIPE